jgi:PIN domain nuclease of toxin-antitoxin system
MKILFDSHALFWFLAGDPRFSPAAREAIEALETTACVSAVTAWEIANKVRRGKWAEAAPLAESFPETISDLAIEPVPITLDHAVLAGLLSWSHRDPFDRMLAAQSKIENMPLVTADPVFQAFGTHVLW